MNPHLSVVLLTRNGEDTVPALLKALWSQRISGPLEIVAIDSGSTDGTLDLLEGKVDTLLRIRPDQFNHGLTRNQAIAQTRGELVVVLVQDARPVGDIWLETLAAPFGKNPKLAGVFSRQVPKPGASKITRHYLSKWIANSTVGHTTTLPGGQSELEAMPPMERMRCCAFDNVACCIRRSVWTTHPFRPTPIAEDLRWAREVLLAGYSTAFVPEAAVEHSHERSAVYEYRRTRVLHEQLFDLFQLQTIPTLPALGRSILSTALLHLKLEGGSIRRLPAAMALAVAWPLGQYVGARRAQRGTASQPLPPGTV